MESDRGRIQLCLSNEHQTRKQLLGLAEGPDERIRKTKILDQIGAIRGCVTQRVSVFNASHGCLLTPYYQQPRGILEGFHRVLTLRPQRNRTPDLGAFHSRSSGFPSSD